jgi:cytochrome c-type biogenesis protein CcmH/NrfG
MLMRIREQKGVIRLVFIALIIVFAASFVIGGVGSGSNFSLSDIIGNSSSSSSTSTTSGSVSDLQKQLKTHPKSAALWSQLSEAYSTNGDTDAAITASEKAVKLGPNDATELKTLATLYQTKASGLNSQAQSLYNEAYAVQQQSPDSSPFSAAGTGSLGTATQDPFTQAASEQYSVQISSLESKSQTLATQAISWDTKALAAYKTIVNRNVNDAQSWLSYATTAEQVGNNKAALLGYQTFLKLVPADPISPQVKTRVTSLKKTIAKAAAAAKTSTAPTSTTTTSTTSTSGG